MIVEYLIEDEATLNNIKGYSIVNCPRLLCQNES